MHPLIFDLGRIEIGPFDVPIRLPSYGLMMLVGMLLGWWMVRRLGRKVAPDEPWLDLYAGMLLSGLIGAKVLLALIELPELLAGELAWREVLLAGGVWLGGVIGGLLFCWYYFRRSGVSPGTGLNVLFTGLPLSHAVGRLGCFLAGCCYGTACAKPWAVTYSSPVAATYAGTPLGVPLHPSPLYEAAAEVAIFAVCASLWRHRVPRPWLVVFSWAGLYGTARFALEFLRGDPRGAWLGLSTSQWGSALMIVAASVFFARLRRSNRQRSSD